MTESADLIIENALLLTMEADTGVIENGAVAVTGEQIVKVGPSAAFSGWQASRRMDADGRIVMPGLINAHTHAAMSLFRGLADDLHLMTWLNEYIFPAEAKLDAEKVHMGTTLACAEMILSGTTCFCDMYLFTHAVAEAAKAAGMRAVVGEVLYDFPSPNYGPIKEGFAYTQQLIDQWRGDSLISIAVEPHSPYLCVPALLKKAAALAADNDLIWVIHLSETQNEVEGILEEYGQTPVGHLKRLGLLGPNLLACHCVVLSDADMDLLARHQVKVVHNPESNMKLASGVAPVPRLLDLGVCVGLGTDGCCSNNNLDLLAEMDSAAKLHKVATLDPTVAKAEQVLRMATIDGARALGLADQIGSLKAGKRADIIMLETRRPHLTPMYHPISHVVYSACGSDVVCSIINGRVVMEERLLTTIDVVKAMADVNQIARQL
jgi:5-methylthioadenosine/S-adenosylhomocysteine deaminase